MGKLPLEGLPYRKLAIPCPIGAEAEVLDARVYVESNVKLADELPRSYALSW
jgi:hypothetical protein